MNLLIITQKVDKNDDVLGFFHRWIIEFSKRVDLLTVICLYEGEYDLPDNVKVLSLGKEVGVSKFGQLIRFYEYIFNERENYDKVFVHMNQLYVILAGIFWRFMNKKIWLWYAHGKVSNSLRLATFVSNGIFTSTEKGFRIKTKKKNIVGQGIDTDYYSPSKKAFRPKSILSVGRISKTKNIKSLIGIAEHMDDNSIITIVGGPLTNLDKKYFEDLKGYVESKNLDGKVSFVGSISNSKILDYYQDAEVFVNLSDTGSLDKVVLEAMSVGLPVVTTNEAFEEIIPNQFVKELDIEKVSKKITEMRSVGKLNLNRQYVIDNHSLSNLIPMIIKIIENA